MSNLKKCITLFITLLSLCQEAAFAGRHRYMTDVDLRSSACLRARPRAVREVSPVYPRRICMRAVPVGPSPIYCVPRRRLTIAFPRPVTPRPAVLCVRRPLLIGPAPWIQPVYGPGVVRVVPVIPCRRQAWVRRPYFR